MIVYCPDCKNKYELPDSREGIKFRCKKCSGVVYTDAVRRCDSPMVVEEIIEDDVFSYGDSPVAPVQEEVKSEKKPASSPDFEVIDFEKPVKPEIVIEEEIKLEDPVEQKVKLEDITFEIPDEPEIVVEEVNSEQPIEPQIEVEEIKLEKPVEEISFEVPVEPEIVVEEVNPEQPIESQIEVEEIKLEKPVEEISFEVPDEPEIVVEEVNPEQPIEPKVEVIEEIKIEEVVEPEVEVQSQEMIDAEEEGSSVSFSAEEITEIEKVKAEDKSFAESSAANSLDDLEDELFDFSDTVIFKTNDFGFKKSEKPAEVKKEMIVEVIEEKEVEQVVPKERTDESLADDALVGLEKEVDLLESDSNLGHFEELSKFDDLEVPDIIEEEEVKAEDALAGLDKEVDLLESDSNLGSFEELSKFDDLEIPEVIDEDDIVIEDPLEDLEKEVDMLATDSNLGSFAELSKFDDLEDSEQEVSAQHESVEQIKESVGDDGEHDSEPFELDSELFRSEEEEFLPPIIDEDSEQIAEPAPVVSEKEPQQTELDPEVWNYATNKAFDGKVILDEGHLKEIEDEDHPEAEHVDIHEEFPLHERNVAAICTSCSAAYKLPPIYLGRTNLKCAVCQSPVSIKEIATEDDISEEQLATAEKLPEPVVEVEQSEEILEVVEEINESEVSASVVEEVEEVSFIEDGDDESEQVIELDLGEVEGEGDIEIDLPLESELVVEAKEEMVIEIDQTSTVKPEPIKSAEIDQSVFDSYASLDALDDLSFDFEAFPEDNFVGESVSKESEEVLAEINEPESDEVVVECTIDNDEPKELFSFGEEFEIASGLTEEHSEKIMQPKKKKNNKNADDNEDEDLIDW